MHSGNKALALFQTEILQRKNELSALGDIAPGSTAQRRKGVFGHIHRFDGQFARRHADELDAVLVRPGAHERFREHVGAGLRHGAVALARLLPKLLDHRRRIGARELSV